MMVKAECIRGPYIQMVGVTVVGDILLSDWHV